MDSRYSYFLRRLRPERPGVRELRRVMPDASHEEKLAELDGYSGLSFSFGVSPSGAIVWSRFQPGRQELWSATLR